MRGDGGRQVRERIELLELTGPHNGQETFDGTFALFAPRPEHDFAPLNRRAEGSLSGIVRGRNALLVHEGEEVLIVHEERVRQITHVGVGRVEMPLSEGEQPFLQRQHFGDQVRARQRRTTGARLPAEAMPQTEEPPIEPEGLPAEAFRRGRCGEVERTEQVAGDVGPAELSLADDIFQIGRQPITAQDARERLAQDELQHVGPARRGNAVLRIPRIVITQSSGS